VDAILIDALLGTAGEMQTLAYEVGIERTYEADTQAALRRSLQLGVGVMVLETMPPSVL
jgi:hypothetical protein